MQDLKYHELLVILIDQLTRYEVIRVEESIELQYEIVVAHTRISKV